MLKKHHIVGALVMAGSYSIHLYSWHVGKFVLSTWLMMLILYPLGIFTMAKED